ncbi:unnamed protein product, partial [Darwinula stevensoni]
MTIALIILFSQYMKKVSLPVPVYSKSKGFNFAWIAVFELFPVSASLVFPRGARGDSASGGVMVDDVARFLRGRRSGCGRSHRLPTVRRS